MKKRKGASLVVVLIIALFMTILGSTALFLSDSEAIKTTKQTDKMKAYYAARSGADAMADWMEGKTITQVNDYLAKATDWTTLDNQVGLEYKVSIKKSISNASVLNIISEGRYNNIVQKVVLSYQAANDAKEYLFEMAAFSEEGLKIDGSSSITYSTSISGPALITNSISKDSIELIGDPRINGDVLIGKNGNLNEVIKTPNDSFITGSKSILLANKTYTLPYFPEDNNNLPARPDFTTPTEGAIYLINQDGYYDKIEVVGNRSVTIDTGAAGNIRKIRVRNLDVSQGHINLTGNGKLELYIDDSFVLGGSSSINSSEINKKPIGTNHQSIKAYYKGLNPLNFGGATRFEGSLYIKSANLTLTGSNKVTGNIISGGTNIDISGASSTVQTVYAPNAEVNLNGSGKITGSVISKKLILIENSNITYFQIKSEDFPFDIPGLGTKYTLNYWYNDTD